MCNTLKKTFFRSHLSYLFLISFIKIYGNNRQVKALLLRIDRRSIFAWLLKKQLLRFLWGHLNFDSRVVSGCLFWVLMFLSGCTGGRVCVTRFCLCALWLSSATIDDSWRWLWPGQWLHERRHRRAITGVRAYRRTHIHYKPTSSTKKKRN